MAAPTKVRRAIVMGKKSASGVVSSRTKFPCRAREHLVKVTL